MTATTMDREVQQSAVSTTVQTRNVFQVIPWERNVWYSDRLPTADSKVAQDCQQFHDGIYVAQ